jgi:hypothetical protein
MRKRYNYEKTKEILKDYHLDSLVKYHKLTKEDDRLPEDPEEAFRGKWRGWFDYFGLDTKKYYKKEYFEEIAEYYLDRFSKKFQKRYLDYTKYAEIFCDIDSNFPPPELWDEIYGNYLAERFSYFSHIKKKRDLFNDPIESFY